MGTPQDVVLRNFIHNKRQRRLYHAKMMVQAVLVASDKADMESLSSAHKNYLNVEMLLGDINENTDKALREEYERIKKLRPVAKIGSDGSLTVEGILKELE